MRIIPILTIWQVKKYISLKIKFHFLIHLLGYRGIVRIQKPAVSITMKKVPQPKWRLKPRFVLQLGQPLISIYPNII